ncbi:MAG: aspartate dehydrogenase [Eubacteriales bacterium]|nr:aspartate dehydrogenase [Eubacteriales bacterium]
MSFFRKKSAQKQSAQSKTFDRAQVKPIIRSSICTGEKVAGFKDLRTGVFQEVLCVRTEADLQGFMKEYGILPDEITTEW